MSVLIATEVAVDGDMNVRAALLLVLSLFFIPCSSLLPIDSLTDLRTPSRHSLLSSRRVHGVRGGGLNFDATCDPWRDGLEQAAAGAKQQAILAYHESQLQGLVYSAFFKQNESTQVEHVYRNMIRAFDHGGPHVNVNCSSTAVECTDWGVAAFVDDGEAITHAPVAPFMTLCVQDLERVSSGNLSWVNDFCSSKAADADYVTSWADLLIHELSHVSGVTGAGLTAEDYVYGPLKTIALGAGNFAAAGVNESATPSRNGDSYQLMAHALSLATATFDAGWCSPSDVVTSPLADRPFASKFVAAFAGKASMNITSGGMHALKTIEATPAWVQRWLTVYSNLLAFDD